MKLLLWPPLLILSLVRAKEITKLRHLEKSSKQDKCLNQCTWTLVGQEVQGSQNGENFGVSVSLSTSGFVLAIGAERYLTTGRVQVYYRDRQTDTWVQRGDDLLGEVGWFGTSVCLSADGTRLVVGDWKQPGSVYVFEWNDYEWEKLGSTLTGRDWFERFGHQVRISGNGKSIIVGNDTSGERLTGRAQVFTYSDGDWKQVGSDIEGRTARDQFGSAVDVNYDGTIVAVGGPFNERKGFNAGHVRVYELVDNEWKPKGKDMEGGHEGDNFGYALSLSDNGLTVAVGARERLDTLNGARQGYLEVFEFDQDADDWVPIGDKVYGSDVDAEFGHTVAMSGGGTRVIAGTPYYAGQYASIFDVADAGLDQIGDDIEGDFVWGAPFGRSVSISGRGDVIAVGATQVQGTTSKSFPPGYVRVYHCTFPRA
jgi:hypothetical protein